VQQFEITQRGLDPDELAELRTLQVSIGIRGVTAVGGGNQNQSGEVRAIVEPGFNLTDSEFLSDPDNLSSDTIDSDSSGTDDYAVTFGDTDEVGQLGSWVCMAGIGFDDAGGGGPSTPGNVWDQVNMADLYGSGPFVDAADDFSSSIQLNVSNAVEQAECTVLYRLGYKVDEQEGGRTRFGR
jgi:hypothetical protein